MVLNIFPSAHDTSSTVATSSRSVLDNGINHSGNGAAVLKGPPRTQAIPAVEHLGLRYAVLLVDEESNRAQPVDPDRVFHTGSSDGSASIFELGRVRHKRVHRIPARPDAPAFHAGFPSPKEAKAFTDSRSAIIATKSR